MLLVHIGIASLRQFQSAPTTYFNSIKQCFFDINVFSQTFHLYFMTQCSEHVEINKVFVKFSVHLDDNNIQPI